MKLLGLTGNIACGKSTLADLLKQRGAEVLDADKLVHELYCNADFSRQVAALFKSQDVLNAAGMIDRAQLGSLVFGDANALRRLEEFVHPEVADLRDEKLRALRNQNQPPEVVVIEAVKLIESSQAADCEEVWCVLCSPQIQLRRLMETRGLSESDARARLDAQPTLGQKQSLMAACGVPLICVSNDGSLQDLQARVETHWNEFWKRKTTSSKLEKMPVETSFAL